MYNSNPAPANATSLPIHKAGRNRRCCEPNSKQEYEVHEEWRWTHPTYVVSFKQKLTNLSKAEIDPSKRMADVDMRNNVLELKW